MVDQLAVIGLLNRFVNVGVELLVLFDQTESGLLDQLLGGSADVIGDLRKPRFMFGCELYFHDLKTRLSYAARKEKRSLKQSPSKELLAAQNILGPKFCHDPPGSEKIAKPRCASL